MAKRRISRFINLATTRTKVVAKYDVPTKTEEGKPIQWGDKGKMAFEIIAAIKDSPTARRCTAKLDAFIQADGFADENTAPLLVNPNQTADDLLNQIAVDAAIFEGYALRVKYNAGLKPEEVYYVPLQTVIKLDNGQYLVNPTIGSRKYDKQKDEILNKFDPENKELIRAMLAESVAEQKPQKGQLVYVYRQTGITPDYPEPVWWAGREDVLSDAEIGKTDLDSIEHNFAPSVIMFVPGLDDTKKDEDGKTEFDYASEELDSLTSSENRSRGLMLTGPNRESAPLLMNYDNAKALLNLDAKRDTIARAVCRHFGVHPVLIGLTTPGQLGQTQEIVNSIQLLQSEVNPIQRQITRTFQQIFPDEKVDWTISNLSPLKAIPPEVIAQMTPDEIRNLGGLPELEKPANETNDKVAQALSVLSPLLATKVLEEMSSEEIRALVGLTGAKPVDNNADNEE